MIKNLIFDFGKVLVDYEYFETLDQIFKTHEQAEEFYHLLIDGKWNENMDRGDSFEETFCKMQQIMPQYKEEIATVAQRFNDFVRGEKEGMRTLLTQLKAEGYHLYGLSNWCTKVHETMAQYPIFQLLEGQVISSEEKIIKPDRAIYERICQKYNLKPEIVYDMNEMVRAAGFGDEYKAELPMRKLSEDKKATNGKIDIILLKKIGKPKIESVSVEKAESIFQ